jgi:hypothetical protein
MCVDDLLVYATTLVRLPNHPDKMLCQKHFNGICHACNPTLVQVAQALLFWPEGKTCSKGSSTSGVPDRAGLLQTTAAGHDRMVGIRKNRFNQTRTGLANHLVWFGLVRGSWRRTALKSRILY